MTCTVKYSILYQWCTVTAKHLFETFHTKKQLWIFLFLLKVFSYICAITAVEAKKIADLGQKTHLTVMVGHLLQYHPAFLELKKMVFQGNLGKLQYIYSNRLNLGKFRNEENILFPICASHPKGSISKNGSANRWSSAPVRRNRRRVVPSQRTR